MTQKLVLIEAQMCSFLLSILYVVFHVLNSVSDAFPLYKLIYNLVSNLIMFFFFFLPSHSRIYEILPQRIQQWQQSPCIAEEHGKKQLERIRRDQQNARLRLTEMERRFHELEGIIAKAKQQAVQQDEEASWQPRTCLLIQSRSLFFLIKSSGLCCQVNEGDSEDTDLQIFCVSCSHPINPKVALRHMERCYAKVIISIFVLFLLPSMTYQQ